VRNGHRCELRTWHAAGDQDGLAVRLVRLALALLALLALLLTLLLGLAPLFLALLLFPALLRVLRAVLLIRHL
jgi:hypothetical protein